MSSPKAKQSIESLLTTYLTGVEPQSERFRALSNMHVQILVAISIELSGFMHKLLGQGPDINQVSAFVSYWTKECLPKNHDHLMKILLVAALVEIRVRQQSLQKKSSLKEEQALLASCISASISDCLNGLVTLEDLGLEKRETP